MKELLAPSSEEERYLQCDEVRNLSPQEMFQLDKPAKRLETILLANVLTEKALVDSSHASELGESMSQGCGQLAPIIVRARPAEGSLGEGDEQQVIYDVIDGFHRTAGKKSINDTEIDAMVIYNISDESMYDKRILAVNSVRSVQFARAAAWMNSCFATTPWAEKGLSVSQAFAIALNDSSRSNLVQLSRDEMTELKKWIKQKSTKWGKPISTLYSDLRLIANSNPEIVREVRVAGGGRDQDMTITPTKLRLVVDSFPGDDYHTLQRIVLMYAVDKRLKLNELQNLISQLKDITEPGMSEEEIEALVKSVKIEIQVFPKAAEIEEATVVEGNGLADKSNEDLNIEEEFMSVDEEPPDEDLFRIEAEISNQRIKPIKPRAIFYSSRHSEARTSLNHEELQEKVRQLEGVIANMRNLAGKTREEVGSENGNKLWWEEVDYLSPEEMKFLTDLYTGNISLTGDHLTLNRCALLLQSIILNGYVLSFGT